MSLPHSRLSSDIPLGGVMRAAILAGLLAGLVAAAFHFVWTEPVIERAIALESLRQQAQATVEEPMVSRGAQQVGLFVGFLVYGLTWSLLFGATFHLVQRWLPASWDPRRRGLLLALLGYWSVALVPFVKYPANPPGVGDPDTIALRQALYLGLLALSVAGTAAVVAVARVVGRGWWPGAVCLLLVAVFLNVALPGNPDPVSMPDTIVTPFRWLSLAGLSVFWAVLGLSFGLLLPTERPLRLPSRPRVAGA